jgi:hypothetical protein
MQQQQQHSVLAAASASDLVTSPPLKQQFYSGYPSPPSSGRTGNDVDKRGDDDQPSLLLPVLEAQLSPRIVLDAITARMTKTAQAADGSTAHAASEVDDEESEEEADYEYEEEEEGEYDDEEDETIEADTLQSSSSRSISVSSPSTSIATIHPQHRNTTTSQQRGSPYTQRQYSNAPIRDTPGNPFLQGGPADVGFSGPNSRGAAKGQGTAAVRERGRMTYVL